MSTLIFSINAVMPIILVILLGYFLQKIELVPESFFINANKIAFNVAIPVYLFYSVYNIESISDINWKLVLTAALLVIIACGLAAAFFMLYTKDSGKRGVLIQCAFRSNYAIIGIPLAKAMGGEAALATAAVISAIGIPTFNVLAVVVLSIFSYDNNGKKTSALDIFKSICKNPLIIGVCSALLCLVLRNFLPFTIKEDIPFLYQTVEDVGSIASPLALLVLGGRFQVSAIKELAKDITLGVLWRLVIVPAICLTAILLIANTGLFTLSKADFPALIAFYGSPVAVSSAIMAESMHNHGELARQLVIWCNIVSIITVFSMIVLFKSVGLI